MTEATEARRPNPRSTGVVSEAIVLARLIELEYAVSVPFGDMQRYDMVVDDGRSLRRAQVKTGRLRDGTIRFSTRSTNWHRREQRGYLGEADDFLVYCPETNDIYRVPVDDCGTSGSAYLRVAPSGTPSGGRPCLRWAQDHVFTHRARPLNEAPLKACTTNHPDTPSRITEKVVRADGSLRRICRECEMIYNRRSEERRRARMAAGGPATVA